MIPTPEERAARIEIARKVAIRAEKLFGKRWKNPFANALGTHLASVYRWLDGTHEVPPYVFVWLDATEEKLRMKKQMASFTKLMTKKLGALK